MDNKTSQHVHRKYNVNNFKSSAPMLSFKVYVPSIEMRRALRRAETIHAIPANTESEAALMARRAKHKGMKK